MKENDIADLLKFLLSLFEVLYTYLIKTHADFFISISKPLKSVSFT